MTRYWILAGLAVLLITSSALARNPGYSRAEIRSMPITERPSRPGHFYGNAVRRNYYRQVGSAQMRSSAGAWQGYRAPMQSNAWIENQTSEYIISE
jgi:hypothetical protein